MPAMPIRLPLNFVAPLEVKMDRFVLRPLNETHNEMDYEAWSSSMEDLKGIFGPDNRWPHENIDLAKNRQDLKKHYEEFVDQVAFAYTVLDISETSCLGCVYIRPASFGVFDCRVDFWVRSSEKPMGLEGELFSFLKHWLESSWGMKRVVYPGRSLSWAEYRSLPSPTSSAP